MIENHELWVKNITNKLKIIFLKYIFINLFYHSTNNECFWAIYINQLYTYSISFNAQKI